MAAKLRNGNIRGGFHLRFAEVFLRLGTSLVAWMLLYAYMLWLAALRTIGCGPDGAEMHQLLLGMAIISCAVVFLVRVTRTMPEVHAILRWLAVPLFMLMPFSLMSIWSAFARANSEFLSICSNNPAVFWERGWAPVQLITLSIIAYMLMQVLKVHTTENNKG